MYRSVNIRIELEQWDWTTGRLKTKRPVDVTNYVIAYSHLQSIKSPAGNASFTVIPQMDGVNVLDVIVPMDVVRVYEFNVLKYQGYVVKVAYNAQMLQSQPQRGVIVTTMGMGNLIQSSSIGLNIGMIMGDATALADSADELWTKIGNLVKDGAGYADLVGAVIDNWFDVLNSLGATTYTNYIDTYLDLKTGLVSKKEPVIPKSFDIYTGSEETITLWNMLSQLIEVPLNEIWFTVGNRDVNIDGTTVSLNRDKTYLVLRDTPFDGTVGGDSSTRWTDLKHKVVSLDHLTRFDLAKSMQEAYSLFGAVPAIFDPGNIYRVLMGQLVYDTTKLGKYLYKPLITQLKFARTQNKDEDGIEKSNTEINRVVKNIAETLKAWYLHNDEYISGALTLHVPENNADDPKIGDKISVEGIEGYFYVEGVAHQWKYGGNLVSNLTITRGYGVNKPMTFKDKLFTRSIV